MRPSAPLKLELPRSNLCCESVSLAGSGHTQHSQERRKASSHGPSRDGARGRASSRKIRDANWLVNAEHLYATSFSMFTPCGNVLDWIAMSDAAAIEGRCVQDDVVLDLASGDFVHELWKLDEMALEFLADAHVASFDLKGRNKIPVVLRFAILKEPAIAPSKSPNQVDRLISPEPWQSNSELWNDLNATATSLRYEY